MIDLTTCKEQDLFNWLKDNVYIDLQKSDNPISRWDCVSYLNEARIELKCRTAHYPTLLIEKKKYDSLMAIYENDGIVPYYINSTPLGIFSFELLKVTPTWETNWRNPKTTQFSNTSRVPKEVSYLPIKDSVVLL